MTLEERFQSNQNLVYYLVKQYKIHSSDYQDAIQEGMLGLWIACTRFDETKGFEFTTYAVPTIRGYISKFLRDKTNTIRIPRAVWESGEEISITTVSLDNIIDTEKEERSYHEIIPSEPDFYPELFEDSLEDFLDTIPKGRYHDVCEEFAYGCAYGEQPAQEFLAKKYQVSQAQISRYQKRFREQFHDFLNRIDYGGKSVGYE